MRLFIGGFVQNIPVALLLFLLTAWPCWTWMFKYGTGNAHPSTLCKRWLFCKPTIQGMAKDFVIFTAILLELWNILSYYTTSCKSVFSLQIVGVRFKYEDSQTITYQVGQDTNLPLLQRLLLGG
jgi:hypothetical protein